MNTINLTFGLDELRVLAKSVGKSRDAELRKLGRLKEGTHVQQDVRADYMVLDRVDAEIANAISELVNPLTLNPNNQQEK